MTWIFSKFSQKILKKSSTEHQKTLKNHRKTKVFQWFFKMLFSDLFSPSSTFGARFSLKNGSKSPIFDEKEPPRCSNGSPRGALKAPGGASEALSCDLGRALEWPGRPLGLHGHSREGDFHNLGVREWNFWWFFKVLPGKSAIRKWKTSFLPA